ncbi:PadR family transcriptional regulator [Brachybacterium sp. EF45031]|nr:PadR family transcriptional regulator [Brachybacterium sillae]
MGRWLRTEGRWLGRRPSMTPVYRALAALESDGLVSSTTEHRDTGPDARVYSLTEAGRRELCRWGESEFEPAERPMDPAFMVWMNFAGQLGPEVALRILRRELEFRRAQRAAEPGPFQPVPNPDTVPEIDPE